MDYRRRLRRLRQQMAKGTACEALLVTHLPDIRYLCGFTGSNAVLAVTAQRAVLFTDGRYTAQARAEVEGARIVIGRSAVAGAVELLLSLGTTQVQIDTEHTTVAALSHMQGLLPKTLGIAARRRFFVPAKPFPLAAMREVKDADEVAQMEAAAHVGCRIFDAIVPHLKPGTAEREIAAEMEFFARSFGADGMSFDTIVASGVRSSLPHGTASDQKLPRRGFVTLDFGVILSGYCSDMTRTVFLGKPTRDQRTAYHAVLDAQEAGVAAVRAGVTCGEVDEAARSVLKRAKLAQYFTHSTGHGVGLEIHEGPRVAANQQQTLTTGMVVTVEPGIYLPDQYGIRIEDTVVVTQEGSHILTPTAKALLTL